jgi:hypothetical protein
VFAMKAKKSAIFLLSLQTHSVKSDLSYLVQSLE